MTLPPPSGWTRLVRMTTNTPVVGSIHSDVPVQPEWPNEPSGNRSPRTLEYGVSTSQPMARRSRSP